MKCWALAAIRVYQQTISPYKGFRCAYAAHTGRCSCSQLGYRAIARYGVWHGLGILDARLHKCGVAHRRYSARAAGPLRSQAGLLDCSCDAPSSCELPSCDVPDGCRAGGRGVGNLLGMLDCCNGCDWSRSAKRQRDQDVVLPPRTTPPG